MKKLGLCAALILLLLPTHRAQAQTSLAPCVTNTSTILGVPTGTSCQPVTSSNQLPVAVYGGSSATSGFCLTSNGPGAVATFQACGGGSSFPSISAYSVYGNITGLTTTGTSNQTIFLGTPLISDTGVALQATTSVNGYYQSILQNTSTGSTASSDYTTAISGTTSSTNYGDFGQNGPNFVGTGSLNTAGSVYLYGQNEDLALGTTTTNAIHFEVNGSATDALTISTTGQVSTPNGVSAGNLVVSGITRLLTPLSQGQGGIGYLRPPRSTDDTSLGYTTTSLWSSGGSFWFANAVGVGSANWETVTPVSAPVCDLVSGCVGAYGVYRLKASYAGNAFNVTRASGSPSTLAVGFTVEGIADWSSVDAFCSGTTCTLNTWYDQSGNGYDLTQVTSGNQPQVNNAVVGKLRAISFAGWNGNFFMSNASLPISNIQNMTVVELVDNVCSACGSSITSLYTIGSASTKFSLFMSAAGTSEGLLVFNGSSNASTGKNLMVGPQVNMAVGTSGNYAVWQNNLVGNAAPAFGASASTGVSVGLLSGLGVSYASVASFFIYNSTLSTVNQQIVQQASYRDSGIVPQVNDNFIISGNSFICCNTEVYANFPALTVGGQLENTFYMPFNYYVSGSPGSTQATIMTYTNNLTTKGFKSGANNIYVGDSGSNDLASSATITAANIYANIQTDCATAKANGYKCIVLSLIPRNGLFTNGQTAGAFETTRQTLISLEKAGWPSFADGFADPGEDPVIGPQAAASNTALFPDGVHPSSLCMSYYVAAINRGIQSLMR